MGPDRGPSLSTRSPLCTPCVLAWSLVLLIDFISVAAADTCTFENGICPQWVSTDCNREACFEARQVASVKIGPAYDHTLKTANGWSAYASRGRVRDGLSMAQLTRKVRGPFCFTAWYHQSGTQDESAVFKLDHTIKLQKIFYATQPDMFGRWQRVRYSEKVAEEFEIIIRYSVESLDERGVFALDDLSVESGECAEPKDGSCDFDWGDTCGYDLGNNRSGSWKLLEGQRRETFSSPDYNTNTYVGGLVYLGLNGNRTSAALTSPKLSGRSGTQCLDFHYHIPRSIIYTDIEHILRVTVQVSRSQRGRTWSSPELLRGSWNAMAVSFNERRDFRVKIDCTMRGSFIYKSHCAIDAIKLRKCQGKRAPVDRLCNFEDGWCSWKRYDQVFSRPRWLMGGGDVKTTLARPANDHTFGNTTGSYVFFSNFEQKAGDKAELISEMLSSSNRITQCANFWYIISGDKAMELKVLARNPSERSFTHLPLWTQKSGPSSEWQQGRIAVPHRNQVVFRATVGAASTPGFVALDDISIVHRDRCETLPKDSESLSATELLSCDFDDWNFCHWSSSGASERIWRFGIDRLSFLGPSSYPDTKKGDVMYVTGENLESLRGAVTFQSPNVGPQSEMACFSVWYHMFGGRGARMKVTLDKYPSPGGVRKFLQLLFQRGRTTADRWYNVRKTVSLDGVHNKIKITVTNLPSLRKDVVVALGPLKLTMGKCDVLTDGLGYCDFEFGTCGWTAGPGWQIRKANAPIVGTDAISGPFNSATPSRAPPDGALFTSPEWSGQSEPQCLEFWYRYGGRSAPSFQVEVKTNGKSEVVWEMPSYPGKYWILARAQILQENKFQVVFRVKSGADRSQIVSLDNVVLRPEPCVHPVECNFDDDLCGYLNLFQGNFRWLVGTGRYEQPQLQPPVPRAKGSSPFAYLDLTTGKSDPKGSRANRLSRTSGTVELRSPLFGASNDNTQLSVQYYRQGLDITSANLSVSCYGNTSNKAQTELQSNLEMAEVSQWTTLNVTVKQGASCQLAVKVTRGQGTNGTMAIASVQVTLSETAVEPNQTSDSPTRCTFEDGTMCGWNLGGLSNQWLLNDPSQKLPEFPRSDHTLKAYKGRFVYAKHDVDYDYGTAVFKSPELDVDATHGTCLSFWLFAVHSKHVG